MKRIFCFFLMNLFVRADEILQRIFNEKSEILYAKDDVFMGEMMQTEKEQEEMMGDVKERDNIFVVELEVEAFSKEEISVYFNDGYLIIVAENKAFPEDNLRRAFYIGRNVAQENIRAAFHNGVLKCMIPKDEKKQGQGPVEIEIM